MAPELMLSLYGAVVASIVAIVQVVQFVDSRRVVRVAISSVRSEFWEKRAGIEKQTVAKQTIGVWIQNRSPHALPVSELGFVRRDGSFVHVGFKAEGVDAFPLTIAADGGQLFLIDPMKVPELLEASFRQSFNRAFCTDGAGRHYFHRLSASDRTFIDSAVVTRIAETSLALVRNTRDATAGERSSF